MRTRVAAIGAAVALAIGGLAACSNSQDVVRSGAASASEGVPLDAFQRATSNAQWIKLSADSPVAGVVGAPLGNGTEILKLLDQAGNVTTVGSEQVRGVDTTHYQGSLDIASALAAASADERAKAESE